MRAAAINNAFNIAPLPSATLLPQDPAANVAVFAQWKRNRDGNGAYPGQPVVVVLQIDCAGTLAAELPDQSRVRVHIERRGRG
jgi:hypothetical protein